MSSRGIRVDRDAVLRERIRRILHRLVNAIPPYDRLPPYRRREPPWDLNPRSRRPAHVDHDRLGGIGD